MNNIITQIIGSSIGTFLAFLFGLFTYFITKTRERWVKHKNALVELEYLLNEHLTYIGDNKSTGNESIKTMKKPGGFTFNHLKSLRIPIDIELKLADIQIINQYFNYKIDIQRINRDFFTLNTANDLLHQSLFSGNVNYSDIDKNKKYLIRRITEISSYLDLIEHRCKQLLVVVRLRMKKEKNYKHFLINKHKKNLKPSTRFEIKRELKKLNKEIKNNI